MNAAHAVISLTASNFQSEVLDNAKPILIDFWAPWCGPCRVMKPILEEAAGELAEVARAGAVNVDEEPALAEAFGIRGIPTLVIMKGREVLGATSGVVQKTALIEWVTSKAGAAG